MSEDSISDVIKENLDAARIMQLATVKNAQPWICNLHYVADDNNVMYWISKISRRHSEEIAANENVAVTVAVRTEKPLVGLQAEGTASIIDDKDLLKTVMTKYMEYHHSDKGFIDTIIDGTNEHKLYAFHPQRFSLFDQVHFPDQLPKEWLVNK